MKGLLLSGGTGTRLRPLTYTGAKQLLPVANKPVLVYAIEALKAAGIADIGIVVGHTGEEVRSSIGNGERWGVHITYIPQAQPLGLAHAVLTASPFLGDQPFVMMLGDNLIHEGIAGAVRAFRAASPAAMVLVGAVAEPERFGVVEVRGDRVVRLAEKPAEFISDLALAGVYACSPVVQAAVRAITPSKRGELEMTDALQWLVDRGYEVTCRVVAGWWKDTGRPDDLLEANRLMLQGCGSLMDGRVDDRSDIAGNVRIECGATIRGSTLRGPLAIGRDALIEDAYIGPYTSIGPGVTVRYAEIEHSIALEGSRIVGRFRLDRSLIGRLAVVGQSTGKPRAARLILGDSSVCEW